MRKYAEADYNRLEIFGPESVQSVETHRAGDHYELLQEALPSAAA
jgi:hypothetical protein